MEIMSQLKHFFRGLREITSALTLVALPAATKQCCFGWSLLSLGSCSMSVVHESEDERSLRQTTVAEGYIRPDFQSRPWGNAGPL